MTPLEKLLKRLPKKYHDRVRNLVREPDLTDDCKYLLSYTDGYTDGECAGSSLPVRSIAEAVDFVKHLLYSVSERGA